MTYLANSYGIRGQELSDRIANQLLDSCHRNPSITFEFHGVLYTRHDWLNEEINTLNRNMFEICVDSQNLLFFDSSAVLTDHLMSLHADINVMDPGDRNGVHLTRDARRLVRDEFVSATDNICRYESGQPIRRWTWPVRPDYVRMLLSLRAIYLENRYPSQR